MFVNEVILICYVAGLLLGVSGLTVAFLAGRKKKDALNDAFVLFFAGMLVICCYDMII